MYPPVNMGYAPMDIGNEKLYNNNVSVDEMFHSVTNNIYINFALKLNYTCLSLFQLAKLGIDIILISRTKTKLETVAAEIGMMRKKWIFIFAILSIYQSSVCVPQKERGMYWSLKV
jgi:hypothetical protein